MRLLVLVVLPGHIHVLLYFTYRVLYYSTTCYNPATGCYMIINNYQLHVLAYILVRVNNVSIIHCGSRAQKPLQTKEDACHHVP